MRALNQSYPGTAFLERRAPARMLSGNIKKQGGDRTQERVCQPCFLRATSDLQLETFFPCLAAPLRMSSGIAAYLIVLFSKALGAPGQSQPTSLPRTPGFLCLFLLTSTPPRSCLRVSNPFVACGFLSKAVGGRSLAPENPGHQTSPLRNLKFGLRNSLLGLPNSCVVSRVSSRPYLAHPVAPTTTTTGSS